MGIEDKLAGVIDLVEKRAITFSGYNGQDVAVGPIPPAYMEEFSAKRNELLACLADLSDTIADKFLIDEEPTVEEIKEAIRINVCAAKFTPVFVGSALKNTGVQPLMDAITHYLPSPLDKKNEAIDSKNGDAKVALDNSDPSKSFVGLAFKVQVTQFGQLTYIR